nr:hypothetical protein [Anaerolineae bacterium]
MDGSDARWRRAYREIQIKELERYLTLIQQAHTDIQPLEEELKHILVLLTHIQLEIEQQKSHPQPLSAADDDSNRLRRYKALLVIKELGQLPYRMGYRSDWEGHLWFGTTLCEEPELANERAILL